VRDGLASPLQLRLPVPVPIGPAAEAVKQHVTTTTGGLPLVTSGNMLPRKDSSFGGETTPRATAPSLDDGAASAAAQTTIVKALAGSAGRQDLLATGEFPGRLSMTRLANIDPGTTHLIESPSMPCTVTSFTPDPILVFPARSRPARTGPSG
jgi:hypothetical protein